MVVISRFAYFVPLVWGCATSVPPNTVPEGSPAAAPATVESTSRAPDDARGARLYDNWRAEKGVVDATFTPDSAKTPELDGTGGPDANGTLRDGAGRSLPNTGHDYRLKNLFGWDLRGAEGIYGPEYQKKSFVLAHNLLAAQRPAHELRAWLASGSENVPALSAVLDDRDLDDLTAFIDKTRTGALAGPAAIFSLEKGAPKGFVLKQGGDATRGKARFAKTCAGCHGPDGRKVAIDETETVGSLSRSSGYEIWFKILHGQPGTPMARQVVETGATAQAQAILDLLAALCDRVAFPAMAGAEDVKDGDVRCGTYLR
jgi:mono/diheme cytochrome c family protein